MPNMPPVPMGKKPPMVKMEAFPWNGWKIETVKGHILTKEQEETLNSRLTLPHLPDMVFSQNLVRISHPEGDFGLELTPLAALSTVNDHEDLVHVSLSKDWLEARKDSAHIHKIVKPYDWTYTPNDYRGTLTGDRPLTVESTDLKINYEKLKEKERILFFDEVILFEDELDDNGCSILSSKLRVMPSGFFCLLRFYLRVDNTLIRVIDTRFHYELGNSYILREYTERESKTQDLQLPLTVLTDPNLIGEHLGLKKEITEKLSFENVVDK